jgi:hypothetical protein
MGTVPWTRVRDVASPARPVPQAYLLASPTGDGPAGGYHSPDHGELQPSGAQAPTASSPSLPTHRWEIEGMVLCVVQLDHTRAQSTHVLRRTHARTPLSHARAHTPTWVVRRRVNHDRHDAHTTCAMHARRCRAQALAALGPLISRTDPASCASRRAPSAAPAPPRGHRALYRVARRRTPGSRASPGHSGMT